MAKEYVITIGREYGSGGREIAEKLSGKLGIPYYDKNILKIAADESGINEENLASEDERPSNPFRDPYIPYGIDTGNLSEKLYRLQSSIIRDKAMEGSCIFVGRCSDYVLRNMVDAYHFFIYAPEADRVQRIIKTEDIAEDLAAVKIVKKIDKQRKSYYQFYTDRKWGSTEGKDMMLNSSRTGIDGCVDMIIAFLKTKGVID